MSSKLRARREALGLTREQLAHLADCSCSGLALLETGYEPRRSVVRSRIEQVLSEQEAQALGPTNAKRSAGGPSASSRQTGGDRVGARG